MAILSIHEAIMWTLRWGGCTYMGEVFFQKEIATIFPVQIYKNNGKHLFCYNLGVSRGKPKSNQGNLALRAPPHPKGILFSLRPQNKH